MSMIKIFKAAWNWKQIRKAVQEVGDAIRAIQRVVVVYQHSRDRESEGGTEVTPAEMERIIQQVGKAAKEGAEAVRVLAGIVT